MGLIVPVPGVIRRRSRWGRAALATVVALMVLVPAVVVWAWPRPLVATVPDPAPASTGAAGWLSTSGGRVVDDQGRTVVLRGFNVDALLDPRNSEVGTPAPLDDVDASLMREAGFDVVRLPIAWSLLEPVRHHFDSAYLDRIQNAVALLERHRLRVVLDMHVGIAWGVRSQVPAWASIPLVPDIQWPLGSPWKYSLSPQSAAASAYFWTSQDWQRDFGDAWRAVAERFRNDPWVAGYDLFNEPHPLPIPPGVFESRYMWPFYSRLITEIGAVDPRHLFIVESTLFTDSGTLVVPLVAPNVVYSPHFYFGSLVRIPFQPSSPGALATRLRQRAFEASRVPAPLWIGEMGIDQRVGEAVSYTASILSILDSLGAGWTWWQWRQDGGWGVRSADGRRLDTTSLARLARPYLEAAPPGVTARESGNGSALTIDIGPADDVQGVVVAYPGFVRGAPRVVGSCLASSSWSAGELVLATQPGAACTIDVS